MWWWSKQYLTNWKAFFYCVQKYTKICLNTFLQENVYENIFKKIFFSSSWLDDKHVPGQTCSRLYKRLDGEARRKRDNNLLITICIGCSVALCLLFVFVNRSRWGFHIKSATSIAFAKYDLVTNTTILIFVICTTCPMQTKVNVVNLKLDSTFYCPDFWSHNARQILVLNLSIQEYLFFD